MGKLNFWTQKRLQALAFTEGLRGTEILPSQVQMFSAEKGGLGV